MTIHPSTNRPASTLMLLDRLVAQEGVGRHAFFFLAGEGHIYPDGTEERSGYVIDEQGEIHALWTGWDAAHRAVILEQWERVTEEPEWLRSAEYLHARATVGA